MYKLLKSLIYVMVIGVSINICFADEQKSADNKEQNSNKKEDIKSGITKGIITGRLSKKEIGKHYPAYGKIIMVSRDFENWEEFFKKSDKRNYKKYIGILLKTKTDQLVLGIWPVEDEFNKSKEGEDIGILGTYLGEIKGLEQSKGKKIYKDEYIVCLEVVRITKYSNIEKDYVEPPIDMVDKDLKEALIIIFDKAKVRYVFDVEVNKGHKVTIHLTEKMKLSEMLNSLLGSRCKWWRDDSGVYHISALGQNKE